MVILKSFAIQYISQIKIKSAIQYHTVDLLRSITDLVFETP
jgi:hypothetical protein